MSVMVRVSDETHKAIKELAEQEGRSITREIDFILQYAQYYLENREKEDCLRKVTFESVIAANEWTKEQNEKKELDKLFKKQRKAETRWTMENPMITVGNPYPQDTYKWYATELYSRELTNDEVLRMNELQLIEQGWNPEAAHKKIYC